eukprot:5120793-Amphidinium_carterae.1
MVCVSPCSLSDSAETVVKRMISSKPDWRKAALEQTCIIMQLYESLRLNWSCSSSSSSSGRQVQRQLFEPILRST